MSAEESDREVLAVSKVEERQRLLAETMAHAEAQEAQYKVIPADEPLRGRWKAPAGWALLAAAATVALFPPAWIAGRPAPVPTPGELDRGLRAAVYLQAQQVEAFRLREGRLPEVLEELPAHVPGVSFVKSNSRVYQIRARGPDGDLVVYDSGHPSAAFRTAAGWATPGSPQ